MEDLQQAFSQVLPIGGTLPTTNTDGSPYVHGPEDYFLYYVTDNEALITDPAREDELRQTAPGIAVELDVASGEFSVPFDVDAAQVGTWYITYSTVNEVIPGDPATRIEGPINRASYLSFNVLAPLAAPNPPGIS